MGLTSLLIVTALYAIVAVSFFHKLAYAESAIYTGYCLANIGWCWHAYQIGA